jgi:hypothetical protein
MTTIAKRETTNMSDKFTRKLFDHLIVEELKDMLKDADKQANKINAKLETMRKKLVKHIDVNEPHGDTMSTRQHKRVQLSTVAQTLDIPVNELMLHFLNRVKTKNERSMVEYRLGHVYFYADE